MPFMPTTTAVTRVYISKAAANGLPIAYHYHRVHSLILHFNPLTVVADQRVLIRRGVEIFRSAAVTFRYLKFRIECFDRRTTQTQAIEKAFSPSLVRRSLNPQP